LSRVAFSIEIWAAVCACLAMFSVSWVSVECMQSSMMVLWKALTFILSLDKVVHSSHPHVPKKTQINYCFEVTWILDSSSLTREMISMHALVNSEKLPFEVHISRIILIARFRTLTPVSLILSATFSKYYKKPPTLD